MYKYIKKYLKTSNFRELIDGSTASLVYRIIGYLLGYILIVMISRNFGANGLGIFGLFMSILNIFVICGCFGFNKSIIRFTNEYIAHKYVIKKIYKTIIQRVTLISVILGFVIFLLTNWIAKRLFQEEIIFPLKIIAFLIPFSVINLINIEFIRSFKIIKISEYFRNINLNLIAIIVLSILIIFTHNINNVFYSFSTATILTFLMLNYYVYNKILKNIRQQKKYKFDKKKLFIVSFPIFITIILSLLIDSTDIIILGIFSTIENVGIFSACVKLVAVISVVQSSVMIISIPKISELFWSNNKKKLKETMRFTSKVILIFSLPLLILLIIGARLILNILGQDFIYGTGVLIILALTSFINGYLGWVAALLSVIGLEKTSAILIFIALIIDIFLDIILLLKYGMIGVALSTLITTLIIAIVSIIIIKKKLGIFPVYIPFKD